MTVQDIIKVWLEQNGYDGLMNNEYDPCGCNLSDFMPCNGENISKCEPAYKVQCKKNPASYCMVRTKNAEPNCEDCDNY